METYMPQQKQFNYILLNEVLYYSKDPMLLLEKYHQYLAKGGVFLIGMYLGNKSQNIWDAIDRKYHILDSISIEQGSKVWLYKIVK